MTQPQSLSVTELNNRIKALMDAEPLLSSVGVRGELSNYKVYPSGHHYFTLKDAGGSLRCVMFKGSASHLRFKPQNGMSVTAWGRVAVYVRDGAYQLYCEQLIPEGAGDLQAAFEQLKEKLEREGLFDRAHKKPLPKYPLRIAVITSSAGAAVHDVIRVLGKRWPMARVLLLPVRVQGEEAPPEIAGAIRYADRHKLADLIITGRGGGSIEDLWAFNDERVARAIYECELPVISAVGHEPDVTIADYVADVRAATPSNAAELAVPDAQELRESLKAADIRLSQAQRKRFSLCRQELEQLKSRRVLQRPDGFVEQRRLELDSARARLLSAADAGMAARRGGYIRLSAKLDALSPLKVLGRGYAIALDAAGTAIKSSGEVKPGDRIDVRLEKGSLGCRVEDTAPAE